MKTYSALTIATLTASIPSHTAAIEQAYANGVPMGGEISRSTAAPRFLVWAASDPDSVVLQRLQIIKGWLAGDKLNEKVYDIACSDGGAVDAETHRCPDNDALVDLSTCALTPGKGAAELKSLWQDPAFDADERAFYYVRVLENPKCRWSTWDAIRAGVKPRVDMEATLQD